MKNNQGDNPKEELALKLEHLLNNEGKNKQGNNNKLNNNNNNKLKINNLLKKKRNRDMIINNNNSRTNIRTKDNNSKGNKLRILENSDF